MMESKASALGFFIMESKASALGTNTTASALGTNMMESKASALGANTTVTSKTANDKKTPKAKALDSMRPLLESKKPQVI